MHIEITNENLEELAVYYSGLFKKFDVKPKSLYAYTKQCCDAKYGCLIAVVNLEKNGNEHKSPYDNFYQEFEYTVAWNIIDGFDNYPHQYGNTLGAKLGFRVRQLLDQ